MSLRTKIALAFLGLIGLAGLPGLYSVIVFQKAVVGLQNLREGNLEAIRLVRRFSSALEICQSKEIKLRVLRIPSALDGLDSQIQVGKEALTALSQNRAVQADVDLSVEVRTLLQDWDAYVANLSAERNLVAERRWPDLAAHAADEVLPVGKALAGWAQLLRDQFEDQAVALSLALERQSRQTARLNGILLVMGLFVALALTPILSERLALPLRRLKIRALRLSKGDFGEDVPVVSEDEIGKLTRSFNYMQSQLKELDRLKSEFISVAAHELRNPVSNIVGYGAMMHEGRLGDIPDPLKKPIEIIHKESDRLLRLVDMFLDLSKLDSGEFQLNRTEVSPSRFFKDAVEAYAGTLRDKSVRFSSEVAPDLLPALWDADRLREVLDNLISNALKFTPEGGRIHLKVFPTGNAVGFSVSDTGPGIPADKIDRVFDKFFQIDQPRTRRENGMGLGLALAKGFVEAHGGTIEVSSEVGRGSTFTAILPEGARE